MYNCENINNFCRVCFKKRPETEMLSVNQSQMDKLLFIGDSNKIIRFKESPKLCIECGVNLDSVYDFIVKLRMNTLKKEQRKQLDYSNSPNIVREMNEPSKSHELTIPYESTVQNVVVRCKAEPNFAGFDILRREITLPFEGTLNNVVVHCQLGQFEISQYQPECDVVPQLNLEVKSESTKSVGDLNCAKLEPMITLSRIVAADYVKQKSESVNDSSGLPSLIEKDTTSDSNSMKMFDCRVKLFDFMKLTRPRGGYRDSFSKKVPAPNHTADSIDSTKICKICYKTFCSTSKVLDRVAEYSGPGFTCPFEKCNFIFTHKSNFEKHIKIHSDNNPYTRKLDDVIFARESYSKSLVQTSSEILDENGAPSYM